MSVVAPAARGASRSSPAWQAAAVVVISFAVLVARRPSQFLHPYMWVEDGEPILRAYAERGLASLWEPVSGYLILATKLITLASYQLAFEWAPEIALALSVAFNCAVVLAVAFSPTHLRWPFLCAVAVLVIPVDPEVYAVSLLAFWWAGLLLVLALIWDADRGPMWLRGGYVVLGGLSSPFMVAFAPLFVLRALLERRHSEIVIALLAVAVALVQAWVIFAQHQVDYARTLDPHVIRITVDRFAGYLLVGPRNGNYYAGPIVLALLACALWQIRAKLTLHFVLLMLVWAAICAATSQRGPIEVIHPVHAAARYFFTPYIVLTWILIWLAALSPWHVRILVLAGCLFGIASVVRHMTRQHDVMDWRGHVAACARSERYDLPIHYAGATSDLWYVKLTGGQCRDLVARSLFRRLPSDRPAAPR